MALKIRVTPLWRSTLTPLTGLSSRDDDDRWRRRGFLGSEASSCSLTDRALDFDRARDVDFDRARARDVDFDRARDFDIDRVRTLLPRDTLDPLAVGLCRASRPTDGLWLSRLFVRCLVALETLAPLRTFPLSRDLDRPRSKGFIELFFS